MNGETADADVKAVRGCFESGTIAVREDCGGVQQCLWSSQGEGEFEARGDSDEVIDRVSTILLFHF